MNSIVNRPDGIHRIQWAVRFIPVFGQYSPVVRHFAQVFCRPQKGVAAQAIGVRKFRFTYRPVSLNSTMIDRYLSLYAQVIFHRTKDRMELPLVLDHAGYLPA
jgi:hypothetical protein